MLDLDGINWARLKSPAGLFKHFADPTSDEIDAIVSRLKNDYLYAPDELRDEAVLHGLVSAYWGGANIIYEVGQFQGIMGFMDIVPEHKASVTLKLWDADRWGRDFIRDARAVCAAVMDEFKLVRLEAQTADPRIEKMARICGFRTEGLKRLSFKWSGDLYDEYILGFTK
jgi:RimJ/RimL family protein N-acetyltransferase